MKLSFYSMLVAASLAASSAWARDITTTTGQVYKNAVVTKTQPDGIRVEHDDGAGFIDFQILSEADRKEFGYNPETYAAAQKDQASNDKRRQDYAWMAARQALYLAGKAAEAAIAAGYPSPYDIPAPAPAPAPQVPSGTTMIEASLDTPGFPYDPYANSGWFLWPSVPSTYIAAPGYEGRPPRYNNCVPAPYTNRATATVVPPRAPSFVGRATVIAPAFPQSQPQIQIQSPTQTTIGGTTFGARVGGASSIPAAANRH